MSRVEPPRAQRKGGSHVFLCVLGVLGALGGSIRCFAANLSELCTLAEQGKHEQVAAAADATIAALPPSARMIAWRIDYADKDVTQALIGSAHAYFVRSR